MSRPFYEEVPGGIWHLTSRGNARQLIYRDEQDYRGFLLRLSWVVRRHGWECLAYCLMPNHFHLLVQTPQPTKAEGMRDLKSDHARAFNGRHGKDGHLFRDGYGSQLIQDNAYLLAAALYVVKNPVRAGLVSRPAQWPWSSFAAMLDGGEALIDATPVLRILGEDVRAAKRSFHELAHSANDAPEFDPSSPIVGDDAYVRRHAPHDRPGREVAKRIWEQARPSLLELQDGRSEVDFVRLARETYRYTLVELAHHLGCSEQTVRRRLRVSGGGIRLL